MRLMAASLAATAGLASVTGTARAGELIIPPNAPTTAGSGGYTTILHSQPRSYQLVIGQSLLGDVPTGARITGVTWRRPTWQVHAQWPIAGQCDYQNFDIYLGQSALPPGQLSPTVTNNFGPDNTLVRSGPISFLAGAFPGGALTPGVNPFGEEIQFSTDYTYNGGDLLLTVRHSGNNCGSSGSLDTVPNPATQAIGVSSYTQTTEWYNQGLIVTRFTWELGGGCAPDLTTGAVQGQPGYGVPNGVLNNDDFFYYLAQFAAGNVAVADLTTGAVPGQPGYGVPNGIINNDDFFYYLAIFAAGC